MRVIHIGHAPLCPGHPDFGRLTSHPGSWVVNHCTAQRSLGLNVQLVTQVPGGSAYHIDASKGFPIHYIPAPIRLRAATLFYFDAQRIAKFVGQLQPHVIHAHGTEESYALAAQATGLPTVITAQGCFFVINRQIPPKLVSRARIVELMEGIAFRRAKHVIAKSSYIAKALKNRFPHLEIHEIPNTFDPALLEIPLQEPRKGIAFVGTITPRKGLDCLVDALDILKRRSTATHPHDTERSRECPLTLHIFGNKPDPDPYEQVIINKLKDTLADKLVLHGVLPPLKVARKLAHLELLVAPSIEEMFGNQVIEALLVGTWPVVSSGTAMEENVLRLGAGTAFTNGDASELARAIGSAMQASSQWNRETTRKIVVDLMGPHAVVAAHKLIYDTIFISDKTLDGDTNYV